MISLKPTFAGKKVLVFGLGLLGGGVATTNWLLDQGAEVTVTDLKTEEQLKASLAKLKGKVALKLGSNSESDIEAADIIVLNPDVPIRNPLVQKAFELGKQVENEATIFYQLCNKPIVGITGTRGKTTTTTWTNYFISQHAQSAIAGNSPESQFLKVLPETNGLDIVVTEMPSFHLELFDRMEKGPDIAVITNIFRDHLPWHGSQEAYVRAKAKILSDQTAEQHAVLNKDNQWTQFVLDQHLKAHIWFFSSKPMGENGLFYDNDALFFQENDNKTKVLMLHDFIREKGEHNLENLLASALAAHLAGVPWEKMQSVIADLPQVKFRQEIIFKNEKLTVINDTAATSPEGTIAAVKRFSGPHTILIAGGTDKDLDFAEWGKVIPQHIKLENLVLLSGSATDKMMATLEGRLDARNVEETLADAVQSALAKAGAYPEAIVLFSPGAKSFEKFLNEFDRGQQFNDLVKELVG